MPELYRGASQNFSEVNSNRSPGLAVQSVYTKSSQALVNVLTWEEIRAWGVVMVLSRSSVLVWEFLLPVLTLPAEVTIAHLPPPPCLGDSWGPKPLLYQLLNALGFECIRLWFVVTSVVRLTQSSVCVCVLVCAFTSCWICFALRVFCVDPFDNIYNFRFQRL